MSNGTPRRSRAPHPRSLQEVIGVSYPDHMFDFVVIDLERDIPKRISITMKRALSHPSPTVKAMYHRAVEFFREIDALMSAGDSVSLQRARNMLAFPEPGEFRLGYTVMGSSGKGLGRSMLSEYLFHRLLGDPLLRKVLCIEPDALGCIPQIAMDRSSDILATIVKPLLIQYTQEQARFLGFRPDCMQPRDVRNNYVPGRPTLVTLNEHVPVDDNGAVFLLLPKELCRSGPAMTPHQYFRDLGPDGGVSAIEGESAKERMLRDALANPGRLEGFVKDRMSDPDRFKARREFRS